MWWGLVLLVTVLYAIVARMAIVCYRLRRAQTMMRGALLRAQGNASYYV